MSFNTRIAYNILDGDTLINVDKSTINTANVREHILYETCMDVCISWMNTSDFIWQDIYKIR